MYSNKAKLSQGRNKKALALISGGLDSALAIHLVKEQGIEVVGLHFTSFFSPIESPEKASAVTTTAEQVGAEVIFRAKGPEFLDIIRNPEHGRGKNLNPCIDCRIYTLKRAHQIMEEIGASFLVTGEVVGQRPMSQRKDTLRFIEKRAGVAGLVVRPLSAKILPISVPEQEGALDREKFLDIAGRGRKIQLSLASQIGLTGFSTPAGGCLLTDRTFSKRLKDLLDHEADLAPQSLSLLKIGRHMRLSEKLKVIVARNDTENKRIKEIAPQARLFEPAGFPGPIALAHGELGAGEDIIIASIIRRYARESSRGELIKITAPDGNEYYIRSTQAPQDDWIQQRMI
jgi:tRNA U34 2-thiouridine synthase MnmA/TrmU